MELWFAKISRDIAEFKISLKQLRLLYNSLSLFPPRFTNMVSPTPPPPLPPPPTIPSPPQTYLKRHLPASLSSTYPQGLISGRPRSGAQQAAFEARKAEIRLTMTSAQIESRYQEVTAEIRLVLEETRVRTKEVEREMEQLRNQREMERRIWEKLRGGRA